MFSVTMSVLTVVVLCLLRLLVAVFVPSAIIGTGSFNDDLGAARSAGFVTAALTVVVNSDARSLLFRLSASVANGCSIFHGVKLLSEVGVGVGYLDTHWLRAAMISFEDIALLHVH